MLSALAAVAALTALLAGIAGAWSPCGFSVLDTIGTALGDARRSVMMIATATFALGAVLGGMITFGGLALAGQLLGRGAGGLRDALAAAIALAAATADWRGLRLSPQIRRQVPERWRWTLPLPLACGLYGLLLGLGFTTFVLAFAVWALAAISFAADSTLVGLAVGVGFGVGRALPIIWIAPTLGTERGQRRLERLAAEPLIWLGMRRLDALGLSLCALLLGGETALAATSTVLPGATDPSSAVGRLAWQHVGGNGRLRSRGATRSIPGRLPALGATRIAWQAESGIVLADAATLMVTGTIAPPPRATVDALAVSARWLVVRDRTSRGVANLYAVPLTGSGPRRYIAGARRAGTIGRPQLDGATVVFALTRGNTSEIVAENLDDGARRTLRAVSRDELLLNPAILDGSLIYEAVDRCAQTLYLGSTTGAPHDRPLLALPSTVRRDPGYQPGYTPNYDSASGCPNRRAGPGGSLVLGSDALGRRAVYVTEYNIADPRRAAITVIPR